MSGRSLSGQWEPQYEVLWPLAPLSRAPVTGATRRASLNGLRVAFIWDYVFRGDEIFAVIEGELRNRFPDISIVPFEHFGNIHGKDERDVIAALPDRLREYRVDAALVGVGA